MQLLAWICTGANICRLEVMFAPVLTLLCDQLMLASDSPACASVHPDPAIICACELLCACQLLQ